MIVTSAVGTYLPYAEAAKDGAAMPVALGLDGMDWNARSCDPTLSGLVYSFFRFDVQMAVSMRTMRFLLWKAVWEGYFYFFLNFLWALADPPTHHVRRVC